MLRVNKYDEDPNRVVLEVLLYPCCIAPFRRIWLQTWASDEMWVLLL